ncbi:MAG TPA: hypothetical protein VER79_01555, partial [Candidatus Limnocylindrales bacterium]|nr:hypothetical protein [Candidatus Limnocylindrales bacterium]
RLACDASDVFAAFGGVAGAYSERIDCAPARPVSMLFFHGTADPIVPYGGGSGMPNIATFVQDFAERNGCDPRPIFMPEIGSVGGVQYLRCDENAETALYVISEGGHTWPGGWGSFDFLLGETTQDISASQILWDFYQAHPLADR